MRDVAWPTIIEPTNGYISCTVTDEFLPAMDIPLSGELGLDATVI